MLSKAFLTGTCVAIALGVSAVGISAQAQDAGGGQPVNPPVATPAIPAAADFTPGAVIKDTDGGTVGTVVKAGAASNGKMAVVLNIDGADVSLPANLFTVANGTVTSTATKAQIQAAMPKKG